VILDYLIGHGEEIALLPVPAAQGRRCIAATAVRVFPAQRVDVLPTSEEAAKKGNLVGSWRMAIDWFAHRWIGQRLLLRSVLIRRQRSRARPQVCILPAEASVFGPQLGALFFQTPKFSLERTNICHDCPAQIPNTVLNYDPDRRMPGPHSDTGDEPAISASSQGLSGLRADQCDLGWLIIDWVGTTCWTPWTAMRSGLHDLMNPSASVKAAGVEFST